MIRREFLARGAKLAVAAALPQFPALAADASQVHPELAGWNPSEFHAARRYVDLNVGKIAYVERGRGPAVLFLHGYPLNGFQWRAPMAKLADLRRCIAIDMMGLGYTDVLAETDLSPVAQAQMILTGWTRALDELEKILPSSR